MRSRIASTAIGVLITAALFLAFAPPAQAGGAPRTMKQFVRAKAPPRGKQHFAFGRRIPALLSRVFKKRTVTRDVYHVNNHALKSYIDATKRGFLEVVIPANTGHVWFRHGEKLYDFGPTGFRVSGVRDIGKTERYGVLVRLTKGQEKKLAHYLERLETTNGAELGLYDFQGDKGFHCVTWLMRHSFGPGNFVKMLGGKPKDGSSMPSFARFMVKRADPVEAVVVYSNEAHSDKSLSRKKFDLKSLRGLRADFAATGRPD